MSIYLDCNATTPIEPEVVEKINNYLTKDFGNEGSHTHEYGSIAKKAVQEARDNIGNLIDASRNEIIFTSGATESNNIAILGLKEFGLKNNKKHIITTSIEHKAVLEPIEELKKIGFDADILKVDKSGRINPKDLKDKLRKDTLLISVMSVNNETGLIQPIKEICDLVHKHGGQVYMDGANMNAMVGLCKPADIGADVCHLNLHKTFCIPHGGGGPGMGPIGVASHLADFLPSNPLEEYKSKSKTGPVSATHWGSASILPISWAYIVMMGSQGLTYATEVAILNANYMAKKLSKDYTILYKGKSDLVAHECILDTRELLTEANLAIDDIAKRLMDYGFHAPTMSWPVANTLMIEPTESESKAEIDRFCESMSSIKNEIDKIITGEFSNDDNPLRGSPHTSLELTSDQWNHKYSREEAAYPKSWLKQNKFWPSVGRVDNTHGDRNLICSCLDVESYSEESK